MLFLNSMGRGARPFLFGGLICLVDSFNERELGLLISVKYDSLVTSQRDIVCLKFLGKSCNFYSYSFQILRIIEPMQLQCSISANYLTFAVTVFPRFISV